MKTHSYHEAEINKYNSTEQFHLYVIDTDRKLKKMYKEFLERKIAADTKGMEMMMEDLKYKHAEMRSKMEKQEVKQIFDDSF